MRDSELLKEIKSILLDYWDPIEIKEVPEAAGEYDQYAAYIYENTEKFREASSLSAYLQRVMTDRMKMKANIQKCNYAAHHIQRAIL